MIQVMHDLLVWLNIRLIWLPSTARMKWIWSCCILGKRGFPRIKFFQTTDFIPGAPEATGGFLRGGVLGRPPEGRGKRGAFPQMLQLKSVTWSLLIKKTFQNGLCKKTMNRAKYTARGVACSSFPALAGITHIMIPSSQKPCKRRQEGRRSPTQAQAPHTCHFLSLIFTFSFSLASDCPSTAVGVPAGLPTPQSGLALAVPSLF